MGFITLREKLGERLPNLYETLTNNLRATNTDHYEINRLLLDIINHITTIDGEIKKLEIGENINKINRQYK